MFMPKIIQRSKSSPDLVYKNLTQVNGSFCVEPQNVTQKYIVMTGCYLCYSKKVMEIMIFSNDVFIFTTGV